MQQALEKTRYNAKVTIENCRTVFAIVRKTRKYHEQLLVKQDILNAKIEKD